MRIAMMTNNYKPFVGGVPISIERLADSLRDLGHTVYIFAPDYKSPMDDDEYIFRFPTMKHKIAGAIPIPNLIYSYVKKTISTLDIDLIHVHHPVMIGNVATRLGKEFHIPVVFTYHTRYEQYLHYLKPFGYLQNKASQGNLLEASIIDFIQRQVIQRYLNRFLEKCDMVFAPTKSIQDYLKPFHIDTPINIAPTGLPHVCFEKHIEATDIREKYLQGKQYLFCTVSRLAKEKNLSFLLRGVAAVKKRLVGIPCFFYKITGYKCPGCGMTHALSEIWNGNFRSAWEYNALSFTVLPIVCIYLLYRSVREAMGKGEGFYIWEYILLAGLLIIALAYGYVRNKI